jgi:translation initiation factor 1
MTPDPRKTLRSLEDLAQLLPATPTSTPAKPPAGGKPSHDGKGKTVRVYLESKGRKGKTVTIVADLQHNPQTMETLGRMLKQHCGAGGTVKDGLIEVQGDHRARVAARLQDLGYVVK